MHIYLQKLFSEQAFFKKGQKPSLDTIQQFLDKLNRPDQTPDFRVIVSGTALKGTTCFLTEEILNQNNISTTLITSPHLIKLNERIRINQKEITNEELDKYLQIIQEADSQLTVQPTFYEAMILAGILAAHHNNSQVLILEVGLGGNFDATNAVQGKRISALTFVGNDHAEIIGPTLKDIATEKAGIFTTETIQGFTCEQEYFDTIQKISPVKINHLTSENIPEQLSSQICQTILQKPITNIPNLNLPARWQTINNLILDGAHSEPRFQAISSKIQNLPTPPIAIIAMTKNHDPKNLKYIIPSLKDIIWTTIPEKDHWSPQELQTMFQKGQIIESLEESLQITTKNSDQTYLITGSFYLCGYILSKL